MHPVGGWVVGRWVAKEAPYFTALTMLRGRRQPPSRPAPKAKGSPTRCTGIANSSASFSGVIAASATPSTRSAPHRREVPPAAPLG